MERAAWVYTVDTVRGADTLKRYQGLKAALRMLAKQVLGSSYGTPRPPALGLTPCCWLRAVACCHGSEPSLMQVRIWEAKVVQCMQLWTQIACHECHQGLCVREHASCVAVRSKYPYYQNERIYYQYMYSN